MILTWTKLTGYIVLFKAYEVSCEKTWTCNVDHNLTIHFILLEFLRSNKNLSSVPSIIIIRIIMLKSVDSTNIYYITEM